MPWTAREDQSQPWEPPQSTEPQQPQVTALGGLPLCKFTSKSCSGNQVKIYRILWAHSWFISIKKFLIRPQQKGVKDLLSHRTLQSCNWTKRSIFINRCTVALITQYLFAQDNFFLVLTSLFFLLQTVHGFSPAFPPFWDHNTILSAEFLAMKTVMLSQLDSRIVTVNN